MNRNRVSRIKQNIVQRKLGNIISIEGMGGDEILGGYNSHLYMVIRDLYYKNNNKALLKKLIRFTGKNIHEILQISNQLIKSNYHANTDLSEIRINSNKKKFINNRLNYYDVIKFREIENGSLFRTLRFRDRSSSACGRELRFPLLDHHLVANCLAMPIDIKFKNGITKFPLRNLLTNLDTELAMQKKLSTNSAQTEWFKNDLKNWVIDNINSLKSKKVIEDKYFKNINKYFSKNINNTFFLWQLVNLNLFYENLKR